MNETRDLRNMRGLPVRGGAPCCYLGIKGRRGITVPGPKDFCLCLRTSSDSFTRPPVLGVARGFVLM